MITILKALGLNAIITLFALSANSQSLAPNSTGYRPDSLYFVHLKDGTTLYSNKVKLVSSFTQGKYLLLDENRRIPLSQVKDFKGWDGTFAVGLIGGQYDAYRLQNEGRRISLYSQCYYSTETIYGSSTPDGIQTPTTITTRERAYFFRKGADSPIQRLTLHNLGIATVDNPASAQEIGIARTNIRVGIGLIAGGLALATAGIITTVNHNHALSDEYAQASAAWFKEVQTNPNTPMPALPHNSGLSALFYVGAAATLTAFVPLFNVAKHTQKALDIYNGID